MGQFIRAPADLPRFPREVKTRSLFWTVAYLGIRCYSEEIPIGVESRKRERKQWEKGRGKRRAKEKWSRNPKADNCTAISASESGPRETNIADVLSEFPRASFLPETGESRGFPGVSSSPYSNVPRKFRVFFHIHVHIMFI